MKNIRGGSTRKKVIRLLAVSTAVCCILLEQRIQVRADAWNQADVFYGQFENDIVFNPEISGGMICCATQKSKGVNTYRVLGWRVRIQDRGTQEVLQTLYYKIGGNYLKALNRASDSAYNYEYMLYGLSLGNLNKRLSKAAEEAFSKGQGQLIFDVCITSVSTSGADGAMNDDGPISGKVYRDKEEIQKANIWTEQEKQKLEKQYGQQVQNLFYHVSVIAGNGIERVSGEGDYCYGRLAVIDAIPAKGNVFKYWSCSGKDMNFQKTFSFRVKEDVSWMAEAELDQEPVINAANRYYTLKQAKEGVITREELASHVEATDLEDGIIPFGTHASNSLEMIDYAEEDFTGFEKSGSVTETFLAVDSAGNQTKQRMIVYIVDTTPKIGRDAMGKARFISSAYWEDDSGELIQEEDGGLPLDSCWIVYPEYRQLLDELMDGRG